MSKFSVGDHVRMTSKMHASFDKVGKVIGHEQRKRTGPGLEAVFVEFTPGRTALPTLERHLILADPDVHTVLGEMDAQSGFVNPLAGINPPNRRAKTLRTAESLINGDRAAAYGHPSENFGRIASLWNAQFGAKLAEPFTAEDVALALVHLKMSRLANTPGHEDSLIDACGYLALASEIANPDA